MQCVRGIGRRLRIAKFSQFFVCQLRGDSQVFDELRVSRFVGLLVAILVYGMTKWERAMKIPGYGT